MRLFQIKAAITKLSYKASKNDILAELSSIQSGSAIPPTTLSMITSFESSHINVSCLTLSFSILFLSDMFFSRLAEKSAKVIVVKSSVEVQSSRKIQIFKLEGH